MLNRYPLWKYIILTIVIFISLLYALPNLYGENPAIQIAGINGTCINEQMLIQVQKILQEGRITAKSIKVEKGYIIACFDSIDMQLRARELLIGSILSNKYIVALNLIPATPHWLAAINAEPMRLGLDLRGGVYFLIQVDTDATFNRLQERNIASICDDLREQDIPFNISKESNHSIRITFSDKLIRDKTIDYLAHRHRDLRIFTEDNNQLLAMMTDARLREIREFAMQRNINILRNRINQMGITESQIRRQGSNFIEVELPGIQDIARAKDTIGATATLEFRLVNTNVDQYYHDTFVHIPSDSEIKRTRDGRPVVLYKHVILTGDHITNSTFNYDEYNQPQVIISLDSVGGNIMSIFTKNNINKPMASLFVEYKDSGKKDSYGHVILVKEETIINIATIQSRLGNSFRITGINNQHEARQLSLLLRAGALVAPIQIVEEHIIGPTLGRQHIIQGLKSCLAGLITCIIFMIFFYKKFGLIAITALITNLILIIGIMSLLPGVTLTMPGIAGIILTLAVAIDNNILINERIKEELNNGRSIQKAIDEGYKGAFSSIFDASITTLIKVVILYVFGTGVIKSFAITTGIGVITSMFTAIVGTRAIVNLIYGGKRIKKLSI